MCTKNLWRCIGHISYFRNGFALCEKNSNSKAHFVYVQDLESQNYVKKLKELGLAQRIPCGQCFECKTLKAKEWSFRCMKEASQYDNNIMLTLTYDDEHLPKGTVIDEETGEVYSTLQKDAIVKFMKRLRKKYGEGIRFILCGEYGSDDEYITWKGEKRKGTSRPHYHLILFNYCPDDLVFYKWSKCEWSKEKYPLYKSKKMEALWPYGFVDCNEVTKETCEYVARYTTKKLYGDYAVEEYENKGREKPFLNMSRNPGIGFNYFEHNKERFLEELPMYMTSKKGLTQINSIRYYDKQLEKLYPEEFELLKQRRISRIDEHWKELMSKTDLEEYEYIANQHLRSECKKKKLKRVV